MSSRTRVHRLAAEDFPMTIEAIRSDNKRFVWGATVLKPLGDRLAELFVPPCSEWIGIPVYIRTSNGRGERSITGPHDMRASAR